MTKGMAFDDALKQYQVDSVLQPPPELIAPEALLETYHPDNLYNSIVRLAVGSNAGDNCQRDLANLLQSKSLIEGINLADIPTREVDVLVIGGGGAGCSSALTAAEAGGRVILATKLRLGDSNTVMAEGGIQAAIGSDDSIQQHILDTWHGGHQLGDVELISAMAADGPDVLQWLISQGMQFEQTASGDLDLRRVGGMNYPRLAHCRDYTGLEMIRVLRESVSQHRGIEVWEQWPAIELLSDELGKKCVGAVLASLVDNQLHLVRARSVILATGGIGRLHLNRFPTSNHLGATGDGLVLAYRIGALMRDLDSFQYHPTGMVYPAHLSGKLVTEGVRASGAVLINALGQRFVDELLPRDVVCAAILRECSEGRGIKSGTDKVGVWLDTPRLEKTRPGLLESQFPKLMSRTRACHIDPRLEPLLVYPTLHYQNGGVVIDENGQSTVPGLYTVGEVSGGIHGRNRIMGNALLEIISFGRRAGFSAMFNHGRTLEKPTIKHVRLHQHALTLAAVTSMQKSPLILPNYAWKGWQKDD